MKTVCADSDLIYCWVNTDKFINNSKKYPFLQNIIAHALPGRTIHVVIYSPDPKKIEKPILDFKFKLMAANIKNICFYQLQELFFDKPDYIKFIFKLINFDQSLANPVDFIKIMMAANLSRLGLQQGLIADMDCIIPQNLTVNIDSLSVYPALDKYSIFEKCDVGAFNCYVENSFSFVIGENNEVFSKILNKIIAMDLDYFYDRDTDGVYLIYIEQLMQYFTNEKQNNDYFCRQYEHFDCLPTPLKNQLNTPLLKIQTYQGGSWYKQEAEESVKDIPVVFESGYQPIHPKEIEDLLSAVYNKKLTSVLVRLENLVKKRWDPNEKIIFIYTLDKEENILYFLLERNRNIHGKNIKKFSLIIKFLLENGLKADENLLDFFIQVYKLKRNTDCFHEYGKIFADQFHLNYVELLSEINNAYVSSSLKPSIAYK